ncbi:hypothetical protein LCGC14_0274070 [marine sediment metagenome]|uniref:Uncharacterized protein n=1 Tax=marine sediment metagenome TaxID=412755 RepID=A0A0F9TY89_9ZZZZ
MTPVVELAMRFGQVEVIPAAWAEPGWPRLVPDPRQLDPTAVFRTVIVVHTDDYQRVAKLVEMQKGERGSRLPSSGGFGRTSEAPPVC